MRVFGDIEDNIDVQNAVMQALGHVEPTVFIGDIVAPQWGRLLNYQFFMDLMSRVTFGADTRCGTYIPTDPTESYRQLLLTMTPYPRINLRDYKRWNRDGNFRSHWRGDTVLIGQHSTSTFTFILGNKEVQLVFDIYSNLLNGTNVFTDNDLAVIYNYVNHCMDYAVIGNKLYIHNADNRRYLPYSLHTIAGHTGVPYSDRVNKISCVDTTMATNPHVRRVYYY